VWGKNDTRAFPTQPSQTSQCSMKLVQANFFKLEYDYEHSKLSKIVLDLPTLNFETSYFA
jgi:hypothetical protein